MMDGLSIRWKILGMSLGLAVGFIGLLSVAIFALNTTNQGLTQIQSIYYPVLVDARANTEALDRMAEGFNTAVTIGEADALEAMNPVYKAINERFNDQAKRLPEQAQDINQLKEQFARYYTSASLLAKELIAGTADMSKVPQRATANSQALEQLKKGLSLFQQQSENSFTALVEEADQRTGRTLTIIWIAGAIILTCVFMVAIMTANGISRRVLRVASSLDEMSRGDADLTVRLHNPTHDEMGALVDGFNRFMDKLQNTLRETIESIHQLEHATALLSRSSDLTSSHIAAQGSAIEQTTQALAEMFISVRHIAEHASDASAAASSAESEAVSGGVVVQQTINSINDVATEVESTSQVIAQLESYTSNVGTILEAIRSIAEQTNLLALNAAIEAARAGEQGRGFAVVADEVRTLASRTQVSTGEIQKVLQELQSGSRNAVTSMERGTQLARRTVEQSAQAGSSLAQITQRVSGITVVNNQIAAATEEQHATSQLIQGYIEEIQRMAYDAISTTSELGDVSEELKLVTHRLQQVATQFKV